MLPGAFTKGEGYLEGPDHVVTWAVGHLVQLADPDEYDDRFKKWRMADLPIVPDRFKLVVRDERSKKQMNVIKRQLGRDDVDPVVNACDAGREGELIFAYLYEKSGSQEAGPAAVAELDDHRGDQGRVRARCAPAPSWPARGGGALALGGRLDRRHERHPGGDDPPALARSTAPSRSAACRRRRWRSWPGASRRSARSSPSPTGSSTRVFDPVAEPRPRVYEGRYHAGANPRLKTARGGRARSSPPAEGQTGEITKLEKSERKERPPLLYDLTSLQRDANSRFGFSARRTLAAAQRLYEEHKALTYPRTNSRYLTSDMIPEIKPIARLVGERASTPRRPSTCSASTCCRWAAWSTTRRSPTTTRSSRPAPSAIRSTR